MKLKFTKNQEFVLRAVYELRVEKRTLELKHGWIEEKTVALKIQYGEGNTNKVPRQLWMPPYMDTPTGSVWALIGKAVQNPLGHNHSVEQKIREYRSAD